MTKDEAAQATFTAAAATTLPDPVREARPPRRLRDAFEPIAMHDVWCQQTQDQMAALGLDRLASYVWGRAAVLGEPVAAVVVAAFGVFEPGLITAAYDRGRRQVGRSELLAARAVATTASLQAVLGEVELTPVLTALRRGVDAADGTGRPLFSGLRALPWPEEQAGQLWRACDLLREHRGDSHLAVCIAAGLGPVAMNILTELWLGMPLGPYTATRGWSEQVIATASAELEQRGLVAHGALTPAGRRFRDGIEQNTDAMEQPIVAAIAGNFDAVVAQLQSWSALCIAAKTFPADVFKRAAG